MNVGNIHWIGHARSASRTGRPRSTSPLETAGRLAEGVGRAHHPRHSDHYSPEDIARIEQPGTVFVAPADVAAKLKGRTS